jgi:hypothetical protein
MLRRFGLSDAALVPIAEIVHDLDLKDSRYRRPEGAGIAAVLAGICRGSSDDRERLERAGSVFDGLYRQFGGRSR